MDGIVYATILGIVSYILGAIVYPLFRDWLYERRWELAKIRMIEDIFVAALVSMVVLGLIFAWWWVLN
jgi:Trk-type K+ transport system membrane component